MRYLHIMESAERAVVKVILIWMVLDFLAWAY